MRLRFGAVIYAVIFLPIVLAYDSLWNSFVSSNTCSDRQFQCPRGTCIDLKQVCDGIPDCSDKFDEADCGDKKACPLSDYFQCQGAKCVPIASRCNGIVDCDFGEDEKNCNNTTIPDVCPQKYFRCGSGICIPLKWVCDGRKDCHDDSDEEIGCHNKTRCEDDEFMCANRRCIARVLLCDGEPDCPDSSDEFNCSLPIADLTNCTRDNGKFACSDKSKCIDLQHLCNGVDDCADKSDENRVICSKPIDSKDCENCSTQCVVDSRGDCSCPKGYKPLSNNTCQDFNECEVYGMCDQICKNTHGSFNCSCHPQFTLLANNHSCKIKDGEALLLYSVEKEIKGVFLDSRWEYVVVGGLPHTTGVATAGQHIYWIAIEDGNEAIVRGDSNGFNAEMIVTVGLSSPENLAVDWMTFNIYFTNTGYQQIGVCRSDGYVCTVLHEQNIDKPRSLALSPAHGLMFWTDWGKKPMIARSGMDGSNPIEFVSAGIHWPNSVTVDVPTERVYWLDAKSLKIETIRFDQTDRRHVLDNISLFPFSIAVFQDRLYWSDLGGNEISSCNKFTGHDREVVAREPIKRIYGLHIQHHLLQPSDIQNPCLYSRCTDMCLLSPADSGLGYSCACPEGKVLLSSDCRENRAARIVIAGFKKYLFLIEYVSFGRHKVEKLEMDLTNINALTYNSMDRSVLIFDSFSRILYAYSLGRRQLNVVSAYGFGQIRALHYDKYGNNVYWCDWERLTVEAMSLTTGNKTVITSRMNSEMPIDIALVPEDGYMFIAYQASYRYMYIDRMSMSGSIVSRERFLDLDAQSTSLRMHYSKEMRRLFWIDFSSRSIESVNLEGKDRRKEAGGKLFHTLTSAEDVLIWSTWRSATMFSRNVSSDSENVLKLDVNVDDYGLKLTFANPDDGLPSPCHINNGNCSHLCLMSHLASSKKVCACPVGLALSLDHLTCVKPKTCSKKEFECSTGECIPLERLCDRHEDCIHGDDEDVANCDGVRCPEGQFLCLDKEKCVDIAKKCDGRVDCRDGSDEICHKNCSTGQYLCDSGECINQQFRCDGKVDCRHAYDEAHCFDTACDNDHFRCLSGQCIPQEWQCDQEADCVDGSDENEQCQVLQCFSFEFRCTTNKCINLAFVCDGSDDCGDGSDEKNCVKSQITAAVTPRSGKRCNPFIEFYCPSGKHQCLPITLKCNGVIDCPTGDDEKDCSYDSCIEDKEFYCRSSRKCIPREWLCDGSNDCGDNSDEKKSVCTKKIIKGNNCSGFKCGSKECISLSKVCNNISDCADKSDEGINCGMPCEQFRCSQKCIETPKGPQCSCRNGYILDKDEKTCIDINECELNLCSQMCNNTVGKYECSCYSPEYVLRSDHVSCKARGKTSILIAASETEVNIFSNNLKHKEDFSLGTSFFRTVHALDVDVHRNLIFVLLENDDLFTTNITIRNPSSSIYLPHCTSFAYDWVTENIFFVESHVSINVRSVNADSTKTVTLHHTSSTQYMWALTIDPVAGFLFWFESDRDPQLVPSGSIKRADCNGANSRTLLSSLKYGVRKMVVDSFGRHLYILNRKNRKIIRINYDGSSIETVLDMDRDAVTFAFFENSIYWVVQDSNKYKVKKCKIYGLHPRKCVTLNMNLNYIHHLSILQENRQKFAPNLCANTSCSDVCVITQRGAECVGDASGISGRSMVLNSEASSGFGTFFAYIVIFCLISAIIYLVYKNYSNPKATILQRFHFHNSTYDKPKGSSDIDKSEKIYLNSNEHSYENPLCQPRSLFENELYIQKGGNSYLETLVEETVDCELNSCGYRSSKESLIKN